MPNWKNLLVAAGLFGFGTYTLISHGSVWTGALACAAGLYVLAISALGLSAGVSADLQEAIKFVRNPRDAIVDRAIADLVPSETPQTTGESALGRFVSFMDGEDETPTKQFDPDAAIARYLAERPTESAAAAAARPSFGRKRV